MVTKILTENINEIWNQLPEHNWESFRHTLEGHKGEREGIDDTLIDVMLKITDELEQGEETFPDSPTKLTNILNERLEDESLI